MIDLGDKRLNKCRQPDCEHPQGLSGLEGDAGGVSSDRVRIGRCRGNRLSERRLHRASHGRPIGGIVPIGHQHTGLERSEYRGSRPTAIRSPARHVPPSHLCRHAK